MNVHHMSKKYDWETPCDLFEQLNHEFAFTLDPCATQENKKCDRYYTLEDNGLIQSWAGEIVFMNPPYGRLIGKWIQKAFEESQQGAVVVCLIPSRTDTIWWHNYCMHGEVRFIKGRLNFSGHKHNAPFPSAIVIFGGNFGIR